jgi:hypothetical protein
MGDCRTGQDDAFEWLKRLPGNNTRPIQADKRSIFICLWLCSRRVALGGQGQRMMLYWGKLLWGVILAGVFLWFFLLFAKSIFTARGVKYNWLGVVIVFGTIGLAIYVVFFVQP